MDIETELIEIKRMIQNVSNQMQELRESIRGAPFPAPMLSVSQPYEHPWREYQRPGFVPGGDYQWGQIKASSNNPDQTRSRVSGTTQAA
jgi:hypothetical protein